MPSVIMGCCKELLLLLSILALLAHHTQFSSAFATPSCCHHHHADAGSSSSRGCSSTTSSTTRLSMGLFDGIAKAFGNADFKAQDERVGASHILIKGDDPDRVLGTIKTLMGEIQDRCGAGTGGGGGVDDVDGDDDGIRGREPLSKVFAEMARRESQCPSGDKGGDLGMFARGTMVREFDDALFPDDVALEPRPGNIIGPVITDFGAHIILVTKRDVSRDQVEEKLARND
mmetsp:Transcript_15430/g.37009  ORF Transcript_15430/g.37009 Transcript_15430/m.37009 type:complete len:230 (-) Transcript_15430:35-724(-)